MDFTEIIGNIAAVLTTVSFIPQAIQTIRTRNTVGISLPMYLMLVTGVVLWFCYGWMIGAMPIILANAVTFFFSAIILIYKILEPSYLGRGRKK